MVFPILAVIGAALGGSALLGGLVGKSKKSCANIATVACSKSGAVGLIIGEDIDMVCYTRVYKDCVAERAAAKTPFTERLGYGKEFTKTQQDALLYGVIGLIGLGIVGRHEMLKGNK